jgi:hypothetical protein
MSRLLRERTEHQQIAASSIRAQPATTGRNRLETTSVPPHAPWLLSQPAVGVPPPLPTRCPLKLPPEVFFPGTDPTKPLDILLRGHPSPSLSAALYCAMHSVFARTTRHVSTSRSLASPRSIWATLAPREGFPTRTLTYCDECGVCAKDRVARGPLAPWRELPTFFPFFLRG